MQVCFFAGVRRGDGGGGVLGGVDVGDDVWYAEVLPQGADVLTGEVLGGVGEALLVAHVGAVRSVAADGRIFCCCFTTHSTPLMASGFVATETTRTGN